MTEQAWWAAEILAARGAHAPLGQGQMEQSKEPQIYPVWAGPGRWVGTFAGHAAQTEGHVPGPAEPQREGWSLESRPGVSLPYPAVCQEAVRSVH